MRTSTSTRVAAAAALALTAAACDVATAPDIPQQFDAQAALEDYQAMESAMTSEDLASFRALGGRTPFGSSSPAAIDAMATFGAPEVGDDGRAFVGSLARRLISASASGTERPARGPIISGWHRGTTFVYDPATDDYQPDLNREGAPETGVRFILYALDDQGKPIVEEEVGYADLIDEGDGSVEDLVLRLRVVHMDRTLLEYRTTLDHDATSGAITVDGFFAGDEATLDFSVALRASNVEGVEQGELTFEFGVAERNFEVVGSISGIEENDDGNGEIHLDVSHGAHRLEVDVVGEAGELDGMVRLNGEPFATIRGPAEDPVIADPDGEPLTLSELQALHRAMHVVEDVFGFVEDILDPVDDLVLLGMIL